MTKSYETFDKPYRRGLVLGLSLAELFLILLFILLLVATAIVQEYEKARVEAEKKYDKVEQELSALKQIILIDGEPITEEQFQDLVKAASKTQSLRDEIKKLKEELDKVKPFKERMDNIDQAIQEKQISNKEIKKITKLIEDIIKKSKNSSELETKLKMAEKYEPQNNTIENLQALADEMDKNNFSDEQIKEIIKKIQNQVASNDPETMLDTLNKAFDEDNYLNPCWFVKQSDAKKKKREVKIFDIQISDNSIIVAPSSLKKYENNPNLDLGDIRVLPKINTVKKSYTYDEFNRLFRVFFEIGEKQNIQKSFRCRFFVDLWDNTSSKSYYKSRLGIVENYFFTYKVQNDAFPH